MSNREIFEFLDLPANGWEKKRIGPFIRHVWQRVEPPRWQAALWPLGATPKTMGSARAFCGAVNTQTLDRVDDALSAVAAACAKLGVVPPRGLHTIVVLWDPRFPKPPGLALPQDLDPFAPIAIPPRDSADSWVILLMTNQPGKSSGEMASWLEACGVHEGFHTLLGLWLKGAKLRNQNALVGRWEKLEEMCAVAMEAHTLTGNRSWLDFAPAWQASLALSHSNNDWLSAPGGAGNFYDGLNCEEYGHFALLAFLDEVVWPETGRADSWLKLMWEAGKKGGLMADPWDALDRALAQQGGVAGLFMRYLLETVCPAHTGGVVARLHEAVGRPAAFRFDSEVPRIVFPLGPLSGQLVSFRPERLPPNAKAIRVIDGKGLPSVVVKALHFSNSAEKQRFSESAISAPLSKGKSLVWRIELPNSKVAGDEWLLVICNSVWNARSAVISVEWE